MTDYTQGTFVGDGQFVGDGGDTLQRLWDFAEWKMIRNCPGRYTLKHRKSSPARVGEALATTVDTHALLVAALGEHDAARIAVHCVQSERCADMVQVAVFRDAGGGGGGVITYCKRSTSTSSSSSTSSSGDGANNSSSRAQEPSEQTAADAAVVYVHTLNTASGLQRKLAGLRIDHVLTDKQAPTHATDSEQRKSKSVTRPSDRRASDCSGTRAIATNS